MKTDRFLLSIVAGIGLLAAIAIVLVLTRPKPTYRADDTPEGVAHNYLLALQNEDYERAYRYLSPSLPEYPRDADEFTDEFENFGRYDLEHSTFRVNEAEIDDDRATVSITQTTFSGGGLFDTGEYSHEAEMRLRLESGQWRITRSDVLWVWCWSESTVDRCP